MLIVAEESKLRDSRAALFREVTPATIYSTDSAETALHYFSEPHGGPLPCVVLLGERVGSLGREGFMRGLFDHPDASARRTAVFELRTFGGEAGEPAMELANLAGLVGAIRGLLVHGGVSAGNAPSKNGGNFVEA